MELERRNVVMSDRDLDAWLAERLFPPKVQPRWWWFRNTTDELPDLPAPPGQEPLYAGPTLSSTGDGMLLVLEAMRKRGFVYALYGTRAWFADREKMPEGTRSYWTHELGAPGTYSGDAETLPHAVALAARNALLGNDGWQDDESAAGTDPDVPAPP